MCVGGGGGGGMGCVVGVNGCLGRKRVFWVCNGVGPGEGHIVHGHSGR